MDELIRFFRLDALIRFFRFNALMMCLWSAGIVLELATRREAYWLALDVAMTTFYGWLWWYDIRREKRFQWRP